jgi:hypothetical protein
MLSRLTRKPLAVLLALSLALWPITAYATDDLWDYSATTPGDNTSIGGVSYAENMQPSGVNDGVRMLLSQLKRAIANKGSDIASSSTTAVCATGTSIYQHVTGTTTITSLGTAAAGCWRLITFDGALLLTHNASSLVLPGAANITTAAGDTMLAMSEGSGNWRVLAYTRASGEVVGGFSSVTATSTDAGATAAPDVSTFRNSASPADNDLIGRYLFEGRDESANRDTMASLDGQILDATGGTEDAQILAKTVVAGTLATRVTVGQGVQIGAATGGDCGTGCLNADTDVRLDGVSLAHGIAQYVEGESTTYATAGTAMPVDDTIPQNTEGNEIVTVTITPKSASSTLVIEADVFAAESGVAGYQWACAVFVDTTASAIAARAGTMETSDRMDNMQFTHTLSAGSTSARTYKLRCGGSSTTDIFINGDSGSRIFGGVATTSLTVMEILP